MMELPRSTTGRSPIDVARDCGVQASRIIRDGFGRAGVSHVKGRGNVVTETDFAVERAVTEILRAEYPEHAILSEETAAGTRSDGWMWVVDPIDGTKNFSQGIPHVGSNVALCRANEPIVALTVQPVMDWTFTAVKGQGAWFDGQPMHVSSRECLADSVVAIDMGYVGDRGRKQLELALHLWPGMQSLRTSGSAALGFAFVASSRWDIYVHSDLQPWDSAPGLLLVREAGGVCLDRDGSQATIFSECVVATNAAIAADFQRKAGHLPWR